MLDHLIRKIGHRKAVEALLKIAYPDSNFYLSESALSNWVEAQGIQPRPFFGKGRMRIYTYRRYVAWYYLRELGLTFDEIGQMFGGRDHSTIMNGVDNHKDYVKIKDKHYAEIVRSFNEFFGLE